MKTHKRPGLVLSGTNTSMVPLSKKSTIDISYKMSSPMPSPLPNTFKDSPSTIPLPAIDPPDEVTKDKPNEEAPTNETAPTSNTTSIPVPQVPNAVSFQNIPNQTAPLYSNPNNMMQYQNPQLNMPAVYPQMNQMNMFQMMGMMSQQQMNQNVPCRYFMQGTCWHGEHCRYSHNFPNQLNQPNPTQALQQVEVQPSKKQDEPKEIKGIEDDEKEVKPKSGATKLNKSATEFRPAAEQSGNVSGDQDQFQNQMFVQPNPFFPMMPSMFVEPVHPSFYANPLAYMGNGNQSQQPENPGQGSRNSQQNDFSGRNFSNRANRREKRRHKGSKNYKKRENWAGKDTGSGRMGRRQREFRENREPFRENVNHQQRENEAKANQQTSLETAENGKGVIRQKETLKEGERNNNEKRTRASGDQKLNNLVPATSTPQHTGPKVEKSQAPVDPNKPKLFSQIVQNSQNLHAPMSLNVKPLKYNPHFQNSSSLPLKKKEESKLETGQSLNTNKQTVQASSQSATNPSLGGDLPVLTTSAKTLSQPQASKPLARPRSQQQASRPVGTSNNQFQQGPQNRPGSHNRKPQQQTVPQPNPTTKPLQKAVQRPKVKPSAKWPFIQPSASKIGISVRKKEEEAKEEDAKEEDAKEEEAKEENAKDEKKSEGTASEGEEQKDEEQEKSENISEKESLQSASELSDSKDPLEKEEQKKPAALSWAAQAKVQQAWVKPPPKWSNEPPKPKARESKSTKSYKQKPSKENNNTSPKNKGFNKNNRAVRRGKQGRRANNAYNKPSQRVEESTSESGFSWEYWDAIRSSYCFQDIDEKVIGVTCSFIFGANEM